MKSIESEKEMLCQIIKGIAKQFGDKCEVVLHDLSKPFDRTIVAIENGHVTGRKVGGCSTGEGLELLRGGGVIKDRYSYLTQTKDGKTLRSTSIYLKDDDGKLIGSICVNYDISNFIMAKKTIEDIVICNDDSSASYEEIINTDVNELLEDLIQKSIQYVGKPVTMMTRDDKIKGIKFLYDKGAFLIKKSSDRIAEVYNFSRFTLYSYLNLCQDNGEPNGTVVESSVDVAADKCNESEEQSCNEKKSCNDEKSCNEEQPVLHFNGS
ncbi:MAG TPA: helix-turn-helix transcriptional regulator [Clostridia bacterium]